MGQVLKGIAAAIGQGLAHGVVLPGLIEFLNASPTAFHAIGNEEHPPFLAISHAHFNGVPFFFSFFPK